MPYRLGLCVLRRTYKEDYETLFPVVILSKHHHHHHHHVQGCNNFKTKDNGLLPILVDTLGPWIFINLGSSQTGIYIYMYIYIHIHICNYAYI
jgi:hypothetical protein